MQIFMALMTVPFGLASVFCPRLETSCLHCQKSQQPQGAPLLPLSPRKICFAPTHSAQHSNSSTSDTGTEISWPSELTQQFMATERGRQPSQPWRPPRLPTEALYEPAKFTKLAEKDAVWGQKEEGSFFFFLLPFQRVKWVHSRIWQVLEVAQCSRSTQLWQRKGEQNPVFSACGEPLIQPIASHEITPRHNCTQPAPAPVFET